MTRPLAGLILTGTLAVTLAGCSSTANTNQPASATPTECAADTDYMRGDDPSPFDTPLDALLETMVQVDLTGAGVTEQQLGQLEEQAASVTNDPNAGPVILGADGAIVTISPSNNGWYVTSTNVPTTC